jgi:hypothetical protein
LLDDEMMKLAAATAVVFAVVSGAEPQTQLQDGTQQ